MSSNNAIRSLLRAGTGRDVVVEDVSASKYTFCVTPLSSSSLCLFELRVDGQKVISLNEDCTIHKRQKWKTYIPDGAWVVACQSDSGDLCFSSPFLHDVHTYRLTPAMESELCRNQLSLPYWEMSFKGIRDGAVQDHQNADALYHLLLSLKGQGNGEQVNADNQNPLLMTNVSFLQRKALLHQLLSPELLRTFLHQVSSLLSLPNHSLPSG